MKKLFYVIMGGVIIAASSCKKNVSDDLQKSGPNAPTVDITLSGIISPAQANAINAQLGTSNLPACAVATAACIQNNLFLDGIVYLDAGATLKIPKGTIIRGKSTACGTTPDLTNLANNKGTLVVRKGAKIEANGTSECPIIWTSDKPAGSRAVGDWGGLVILGNAPISATPVGATTCQSTNNFETFAALQNGLNGYGGNTINDNSGCITYNRFEFGGGTVTAPNAEVNGLTLCGVGCGTTINHIEVANSGDDAIEFFGGTVNIDHALTFNTKDDDFDFDEGYTGALQFIIAYRTNVADNSGSAMIEVDGNSQSLDVFPFCTKTTPIILNATLVGPGDCNVAPNCGGAAQNGRFDAGIVVRRQGRMLMANSYVITQAMPAAIVSTPTTCSQFGILPNGPSWVGNTIFQFNTATPAVNDNDESAPFAPVSCNLTNDNTPGNCNTMVNSLLNPSNANSSLPNFGAFALGGFLENTPASPGFTGGLNTGGVTLGACSFSVFRTIERGGVPSFDVWTNSPWISIATN